jgi:hypothetical protein
VCQIVSIFISFLGIVVGLLTANRPRFWWQEIFHNCALYWCIPCFAAIVWLLWRLSCRRCSALLIVGLLGYGYGVFSTFDSISSQVFPRRFAAADGEFQRVDGIWIDSWSLGDDVGEIARVVSSRQPTFVVIQGDALEQLDTLSELNSYPVHISSSSRSGFSAGEIRFYSRAPFVGEVHNDLGLQALPGGWCSVALSPNHSLEVGFLALKPSRDAQSFERNRISARRLSSLMRNSERPRLLLANFNATPTSQLVAIYPEQTRMYSLRFGAKMSSILSSFNYFGSARGLQAYASFQVAPESFELLARPNHSRPMMYFSIFVPGLRRAQQ